MTTLERYPASLDFQADYHVTRWRPLVQWLLAIPQLAIAWSLSYLRNVLILISLFCVLFTKRIPRPIFGAITMTYRYDWRAHNGGIEFHPPHGEWIRLLRANGFSILDLVELEPPADAVDHQYYQYVKLDWARRWPAEEIWVAEKAR